MTGSTPVQEGLAGRLLKNFARESHPALRIQRRKGVIISAEMTAAARQILRG
jgi:hypothetical protein